MPFWTFRTIEEELEVSLVHWRLLEASFFDQDLQRTRHFVGTAVAERTGRVSSAIEQFDPGARQGLTQSGRAYGLFGEPSYDSAAEHVWNMWCRINGVANWIDVTRDAFAADDAETTARDIKTLTGRYVQ